MADFNDFELGFDAGNGLPEIGGHYIFATCDCTDFDRHSLMGLTMTKQDYTRRAARTVEIAMSGTRELNEFLTRLNFNWDVVSKLMHPVFAVWKQHNYWRVVTCTREDHPRLEYVETRFHLVQFTLNAVDATSWPCKHILNASLAVLKYGKFKDEKKSFAHRWVSEIFNIPLFALNDNVVIADA